jgi:phage-related protein
MAETNLVYNLITRVQGEEAWGKMQKMVSNLDETMRRLAAEAITPVARNIKRLGESGRLSTRDLDTYRASLEHIKEAFPELAVFLEQPIAQMRQMSSTLKGLATRQLTNASRKMKELGAAAVEQARGVEGGTTALAPYINKLRTLANSSGITARKVSGLGTEFLNASQSIADPTVRNALANLGRGLQNLGSRMQRQTDEMKGRYAPAVGQTGRELQKLAKILSGAIPKTDQLNKKMQEAAKTTNIWQSHSIRTQRILNTVGSAAHGAMMGFSLLSGSMRGALFSLIFLRFSFPGLALKMAAMVLTLGMLVKGFNDLAKAAASAWDSLIRMEALTGSMQKGAQMAQLAAQAALDTGRAYDETAKAAQRLYREGLFTIKMWKAVQAAAVATGEPMDAVASRIAQAIGRERLSVQALRRSMMELGVSNIQVTEGMRRSEVANRVAQAVLDKYTQAIYRNKESVSGLGGAIRELFRQISVLIGTPVVREFLVPLLKAIKGVLMDMRNLIAVFRQSVAMQELWQDAIEDFRAGLEAAAPFLKLVWRLFKEGILVVLKGSLILLRLASLGFKWLANHLWAAEAALKGFLRMMKPVWDWLGILSHRLKQANFRGALQWAKQFALNFPGLIRGALARTAGALLKFLVSLGIFHSGLRGAIGSVRRLVAFFRGVWEDLLQGVKRIFPFLARFFARDLPGLLRGLPRQMIRAFRALPGFMIRGLRGLLREVPRTLRALFLDLPKAILRALPGLAKGLQGAFLKVFGRGAIRSLFRGIFRGGIAGIITLILELLGDSIIDANPKLAEKADQLKGAISGALTGALVGMNFGPIGAAAGVIVGSIVGAIVGREKIDEITRKIFEGISKAVGKAFELIGQFIETLSAPEKIGFIQDLGKAWADLQPILNAVSQAIKDYVLPPLRELMGSLGEWAERVVPKIGHAFENVWNIIAPILRFILSSVGNFLKVIGDWFSRHRDEIVGVFRGMWTIIQGVVQIAVSVIGGLIELFFDLLSGDFEGAKDTLSRIWDGLWKGLGKIVEGTLTVIDNLLRGAIETLGDLAYGIGSSVADNLTKALAGMGQAIWEAIKGAMIWAINRIPGIKWDPDKGFQLDLPFNPGGGEQAATRKAGTVGTAGLATMPRPVVNRAVSVTVNLTGNYILDDHQARNLANSVAEVITRRLNTYYPRRSGIY